MPLVDLPPEIRLLTAAATDLEAVDWLDAAGAGTLEQPVLVRHLRSRAARSDEWPCISIEFGGVSDRDMDEIYKTGGERVRICHVRLWIDLPIPADEATRADPNAGADATGWLTHARVAAVALQALRDPDGALGQLAWWSVDVDMGPDEESKPDKGRLVKAIDVLYRCSTTDPNVLFPQGANA